MSELQIYFGYVSTYTNSKQIDNHDEITALKG